MTDEWFYKTLGQEWGPVSFDEIVELAKAEQLAPSDEVRGSRDAPWVPAGSIVGLFPEPEELTDLSELDITFVDASRDAARPASSQPQTQSSTAVAEASTGRRESCSWFAYLLGYEMGPMSFSELELMAASGAVSATDYVRPDDGSDWVPAGEAPELAGAFANAHFEEEEFSEAPTSAGGASETRIMLPEAHDEAALPEAVPATHAAPHALQPQITTSGDQTVLQIVIQTPDGGTQTISAPIQLSMLAQPPGGAPPTISLPAIPVPVPASNGHGEAVPSPSSVPPPILDDDEDESPLGTGSEDEDWDDDEDGPRAKEDDSKKWWCRIDGQEHGPVELKQLRRTVAVGRLKPDDLVRRGRKGEWVAASTFPELFRKRSSKKLAVDLEKITGSDPEIGTPSTAAVGSSGAGTAGPSRDVAALIRQSHAAALDKDRIARKYAAEEEDEPQTFAEKLKRNPKLAVIGGLLLLIAVYKFMPFSSADKGTYDQYAAIYAEMLQLRDSNASDEEWSKLTDKANTVNDAILKDLEQTASASEPAKQQLLWAGRDYLIPMLGDARNGESENEKLFKEHLDNALAFIEGRSIEDGGGGDGGGESESESADEPAP